MGEMYRSLARIDTLALQELNTWTGVLLFEEHLIESRGFVLSTPGIEYLNQGVERSKTSMFRRDSLLIGTALPVPTSLFHLT